MNAPLSETPESPPAPASSAPGPIEVHSISGLRRILLWPLGLLLRLWGASLRFDVSPETERWLRKADEPVAFVLWHNRLFVVSEVHRRYRNHRPIYGLVSASKDGAWLAAFFSLVGIRSVRGSSSRGAREAVTALVDVVRAGHDIGITPDGPRGPMYDFKPGAWVVARRTRAPILLLGAAFESAWQLRSWDRFYLPKPFSTVRLFCRLCDPAELSDRTSGVASLRSRLEVMSPDGPSNDPGKPST